MGYQDLFVWQKAMDLATNTYQISKKFPKEEIYGLTSQLRRCAVFIPSNIAEDKVEIQKRVCSFSRNFSRFFRRT